MRANTRVGLLLMFILFQTIGFAQSNRVHLSKGPHKVVISFGGISKGEIAIMSHMEDSLGFTDPEINAMLRISSFHLAVKCNGNVLKYMENKSGNKLTTEMKNAVRELLPGCALTFDGIKAVYIDKNVSGWGKEFDPGMLKLTLK